MGQFSRLEIERQPQLRDLSRPVRFEFSRLEIERQPQPNRDHSMTNHQFTHSEIAHQPQQLYLVGLEAHPAYVQWFWPKNLRGHSGS